MSAIIAVLIVLATLIAVMAVGYWMGKGER